MQSEVAKYWRGEGSVSPECQWEDCSAGYKGLKYIWSNGPTDHKPETSQSVELIRESESKIEIEIINKKKSGGLLDSF